jgi:cystathionine beta-synthase
VEGTGYDFIPRVLDRCPVDKWYKSTDSDTFAYSRRLIKEEGMFVGGSSGAALWAAIQEGKKMEAGKRIVIILPDSVRNYMTKYLSDDWMYVNGFIDEKKVLESYTPKLVENRAWGQNHTVGDLKLEKSPRIKASSTIKEAIKEMGTSTQVLVTDDSDKVIGLFTTDIAMDKISKGKIVTSDTVDNCLMKIFRKTSKDIPLSELARIFTITRFVVVDEESVVTHHDLLNFFDEKS